MPKLKMSKKERLEREVAEVVKRHCPEMKDFLLAIYMPSAVGFINTNKNLLEHGRMLALMLKWCSETAELLHEQTQEPVFKNASIDCEANKHFLTEFLINAKTILKKG